MRLFPFHCPPDDELCEAILCGAVLIFPTETIYGIGCSALQSNPIRRVFEIKGRAPNQPPPVLISGENQLSTLVARVPDCARGLMESYWPGALTLILPARDEISSLLCGLSADGSTRTIGVRLTNHAFARELCARVGPLVATSANFSGALGSAAAPHVLDDIPDGFKAHADFVIDGGALHGKASTVVDCSGDVPRVLRAGAVDVQL